MLVAEPRDAARPHLFILGGVVYGAVLAGPDEPDRELTHATKPSSCLLSTQRSLGLWDVRLWPTPARGTTMSAGQHTKRGQDNHHDACRTNTQRSSADP